MSAYDVSGKCMEVFTTMLHGIKISMRVHGEKPMIVYWHLFFFSFFFVDISVSSIIKVLFSSQSLHSWWIWFCHRKIWDYPKKKRLWWCFVIYGQGYQLMCSHTRSPCTQKSISPIPDFRIKFNSYYTLVLAWSVHLFLG